jgi:hypothetical protein
LSTSPQITLATKTVALASSIVDGHRLPSLGRSDVLEMVRTELHEQPLLLACDVSSGQFGSRRGC